MENNFSIMRPQQRYVYIIIRIGMRFKIESYVKLDKKQIKKISLIISSCKNYCCYNVIARDIVKEIKPIHSAIVMSDKKGKKWIIVVQ